MDQVWVNRAVSAEAAVAGRHLKRLWALPGTQLGVVAWPAARRDRWFGAWHYWWQAHLLDCLVDAELRDPQPERRITDQAADPRAPAAQQRVGGSTTTTTTWPGWRWRWSGPARIAGVGRAGARLRKLNDQLLNAWVPEEGGGIPWRKQDQFFNAPANGPAGILLARYGDRLRRAQQMADWIDETLIDPETHLVFDGIKAGSLVRAQYSYCQGVVLGLETELAARTHDDRHGPRVHRLVAAVDEHMTAGGVLRGSGGGDGGLFSGITARYLALGRHHAARRLRRRCRCPRDRPPDRAVFGAGGLGQPAIGGRAATVRAVLERDRRVADGRWAAGTVRRRGGQWLRRSPSAICRCSCRVGC